MFKSVMSSSNNPRLTYGYIAAIDTGGSNKSRVTFANRDGSTLLDPNGVPLQNEEFNYDSSSADQFLNSHAASLATLHTTKVANASNLQNSQLEAIGWAPPGQSVETKEGFVSARFQNIKDLSGHSLQNIPVHQLRGLLQAKSVSLASNFHMTVSNDMTPWALQAIRKQKHTSGNHLLIATGTGCGVISYAIQKTPAGLIATVEPGEAGNAVFNPSDNTLANNTIEAQACSYPALIRNFMNYQNYNPRVTQAFVDLEKAEIVTKHTAQVDVPESTDRSERAVKIRTALETLKTHPDFTIIFSESRDKVTISFNPTTEASKALLKKASQTSVKQYIQGLERLIQAPVMGGLQSVQLTGALANGIDGWLVQNANTTLPAAIRKALTDRDNPGLNAQMAIHQTQIEMLPGEHNEEGRLTFASAPAIPQPGGGTKLVYLLSDLIKNSRKLNIDA